MYHESFSFRKDKYHFHDQLAAQLHLFFFNLAVNFNFKHNLSETWFSVVEVDFDVMFGNLKVTSGVNENQTSCTILHIA